MKKMQDMGGQPPEGELVRVAGERRSGDHQRLGQHAGFRHAEHRLVIGAEALRDAGDLRALGEDMLAGCAGDVHGKPLREHRREPHRVQHFARHEDIDAHGALGMAKAAHKGAGDRAVHPRVGGFGVRQPLAFSGKAHPRIGRRQHPARAAGMGRDLSGNHAPKGFDIALHTHTRFSRITKPL